MEAGYVLDYARRPISPVGRRHELAIPRDHKTATIVRHWKVETTNEFAQKAVLNNNNTTSQIARL